MKIQGTELFPVAHFHYHESARRFAHKVRISGHDTHVFKSLRGWEVYGSRYLNDDLTVGCLLQSSQGKTATT